LSDDSDESGLCIQAYLANKPPIPFIPEKDKLQEAVKTGASTIKLMLPHEVSYKYPFGLAELLSSSSCTSSKPSVPLGRRASRRLSKGC
jgi:hypothetical protein